MPPADTHLELHYHVVRCPVCRKWTTGYGGIYKYAWVCQEWLCIKRVYMHEMSCCTAANGIAPVVNGVVPVDI